MEMTVVTFLAGVALGAAVATAFLLARQTRLATASARLEAELAAARQAVDEQRSLLAETQAQLRDTFAALSKDALKENRQDFLANADRVLQPVRETLDRVQTQLRQVDKDREGSYQAVRTQLTSLAQAQEQLRQSAETLSRSLRSPNVRGQWGEIQLRRIVELAGMVEQCDFVEKATTTTEDGGRQTPDLLVKLPGGASIVVDAKVPIDAYQAAMAARTDASREEHLAAHVRQVRDHVRALGGKEYWKQFQPAPEFVVMFLPLEPLLAAAFERDATLFDQAATQRVVLATPMTLLALLKAVAYGWQQQQIARNAEEIQQLGRDLHDRLATMVEHLAGVGRNLKQAADSYDRLIGSLETKVLPGARRFKDLGVSSTKVIEAPDTLDLSLRKVTRDELTVQPVDEPAVEPADAGSREPVN
jgi:DNA recombination protein RmuC